MNNKWIERAWNFRLFRIFFVPLQVPECNIRQFDKSFQVQGLRTDTMIEETRKVVLEKTFGYKFQWRQFFPKWLEISANQVLHARNLTLFLFSTDLVDVKKIIEVLMEEL